MFRRAILLKIVSWLVFSPTLAVAQPPESLHCRADVRATMTRAWRITQNGTAPYEAAFFIRENGSINWLGTSREYHKMHVGPAPTGTIALFHTHPNDGLPNPSPTDKAYADAYGIVMYTITSQGLYSYSHPLGEKLVRPNMEWENACK